MMENYSLSDIAAVSGDNKDGWDGGWFWIVVLFLFMFGFGGFNKDTGSLTRAELAEGFNFQDMNGQLRSLSNGLCDGFYAQNTTMLNGFSSMQNSMNALGTQIAENRFAAQQCCCETNRNIDAVRAEAYKNTCDITTAIHAEAEQTRSLITANTVQELRDRLADRDRDLQFANFQISQQVQNAALIGALRPFPQPAYITNSPYTSATVCNCTTTAAAA